MNKSIMPIFKPPQVAWHLMRANAQRKGIGAQEALGHVGSESYTICSPVGGLCNTWKIPRVRPQAVEEKSILDILGLCWALPPSIDGAQMLHLHALPPV